MKSKVETIMLRQYADASATPQEMIETLLRDVEQATQADIVGATGLAWAVVHGVLQELIKVRKVYANQALKPWEYRWIGGR